MPLLRDYVFHVFYDTVKVVKGLVLLAVIVILVIGDIFYILSAPFCGRGRSRILR